MKELLEDVFLDCKMEQVTIQEIYLKAIRRLKNIYKEELKRIKKIKHLRHLSLGEFHEQTKNTYHYQELLLEQQKKCKKSEPQDFNDQVILSVTLTQKKNYLIKTEKGIHYQCKCHLMAFQTNQELGGHQRTLK
ncbi:unnamed protein product [Paramecium sonneborni]|uniref:Uncharacterized protein n=1 Tax=Paramecium sonneborni TaxID=65129 RepID=A0A8S1QHZ2_9CILI|nr:unnamed protein product [Paramecium sonneborni]